MALALRAAAVLIVLVAATAGVGLLPPWLQEIACALARACAIAAAAYAVFVGLCLRRPH
ncbi:MAG: hypothetical protein U5K33_10655 [Halofilum sp. (in: g-proteobacteria)]|nr:hypothetical protein [Halofilum sp. (in: g-proteobacteria)]